MTRPSLGSYPEGSIYLAAMNAMLFGRFFVTTGSSISEPSEPVAYARGALPLGDAAGSDRGYFAAPEISGGSEMDGNFGSTLVGCCGWATGPCDDFGNC